MIGGESGGVKLKKVELYNWKTKERCYKQDLPYGVSGMVGTIINGNQVFCGGETNVLLTKCYKLVSSNLTWIEVSNLLNATFCIQNYDFDQKLYSYNLVLNCIGRSC